MIRSLAQATFNHVPIEFGSGLSLLVPGLSLLAAVLCLVFAAMRVKSKLPAWITVGCLAAAFGAVVMLFLNIAGQVRVVEAFEWINITWGDGPGQAFVANWSFYVDNLTLIWMLFVTGLGALIALYASEYMSDDVGVPYCRFFGAFSLFVFSMSCLVMGGNLLVLFLGWEGVGLCSYLLIGYFYKRPSAVAAAKKAFIVNRIGDLGLLIGIFLTFTHFGTVEYKELFAEGGRLGEYVALMKAGHVDQIPFVVQLIPVLFMIGAFGKSAQLPLFVWLPDAMEGPTPVSALIHAATMVTAGVYLIARMYPLFLCSSYALPIVAWVGALTALVAATIAMAQFDIKRIMAYSTVSQLGYMFCGLAVLSSTGGVFHVVTHAFFKATLFLCCGAVMHGFAGQLDLRKLSGEMKIKGWGIVGVAMLIGCINLAGVPFTAGYFSKDMILAESFVTPGMAPIGWILLFTAGLTAYYTFRVFFRVFVGPVEFHPGDDHHDDPHESDGSHAGDHGDGGGFHPHAPGWAINTVLATLAVASILAAGLYFIDKQDHGWVGHMLHSSTAEYEGAAAYLQVEHDPHAVDPHMPDAYGQAESGGHGTFLGLDPHKVMYYVSAIFGICGIATAFYLHYQGRTTAATAKADELLPAFGPVARWAQHKWYVDELYDFAIVKPLWVLAHICYLIDKLLVDGLVNLFGAVPRIFGKTLRPSQSGELHGYASGMAMGLAFIMLVVLVLTIRAGVGS